MPDSLVITRSLAIGLDEIEMEAVRGQGPGGQNVNKVASTIHLRFDIHASSLPDRYRQRLLALSDQRITSAGVIVIKAQDHRSQERNRQAALQRLVELIREVTKEVRPRRPTRPTAGAKKRRLDEKKKRGRVKALRGSATD